MNCIKLLDTDCRYRIPGDSGECRATICQKTQDDILDNLKMLVKQQSPKKEVSPGPITTAMFKEAPPEPETKEQPPPPPPPPTPKKRSYPKRKK